MTNLMTDAALIQRARRGDQKAFGELVLRYRRPVLSVAYRMTGDAASAEDIAQAAFLQAWQQLGTLHESAALKGWLYRLAVNASIDHLRRNPAPADLSDEAADPAPTPEGEALERERAEAVRRAVLALPEQCRAALILREFEGLSYKEVAQALAIPLGTVMSRLSYARGLLRAALGPYLAYTSRSLEER